MARLLSISLTLSLGLITTAAMTACTDSGSKGGDKPAARDEGPKTIRIDGSSTVFPITEAVAEEYQKGKKVRVTIGVSGTGGGFKKFCRKETDLTGASRPIKPSEVELCQQNGVEYIEMPVAYDGLAVVVNPQNTWVDHLTPEELKKMWAPEAQGQVMKWSQIREGWPDEDLKLYGPGVDSGTYDYFTKAIVGKEHASRGDFTSSEDDNVLVHGVSTDKGGLGFFGLAYYTENKDKLKLIPIDDGKADNGEGPILPSIQTVKDGTYQPLSRPVFLYARKDAASRDEVKALVHFYVGAEGRKLIEEVGYIGLGGEAYGLVQQRFDAGTTGSLFEGKGSKVGVTVEKLLGGGAG